MYVSSSFIKCCRRSSVRICFTWVCKSLKSLGSSTHTARAPGWLAGLPKCCLSTLQLFSHKCWEQGVRCWSEIASWQLPGELGKLPAACSLSHSLTSMTSPQMWKWHLRGLCAELVICPHPVYSSMQKHAWCEKCVHGIKPEPKQTKK